MITINVGKIQRMRIWIEDLPDADYVPTKTFKQTFKAGNGSTVICKAVAIELYASVGPRSVYGLLGGSLSWHATDNLDVSINASDSNGRVFYGNLSQQDTVRVGLPTEYIDTVLNTLQIIKDRCGLPSGKLLIDHAAHGTVSSCNAVYKKIALMLIKIFCMETSNPSEKDLLNIFFETQ